MADSDRRCHRPDLTCSWNLIGTLAAVVLVLAMFARGTGTLWVDARATERVQELDGAVFAFLADVGNALGESGYAIILVAILILLAAITKRRRELIFLAFLLGLRGLGTVLKGLFHSPRPTSDVAEVVRAYDGLGFPSGHSLTSSVAAGGIVFLALRQRNSPAVRFALALAWLVCITLTAFARIWVGAHWLTDTIGGTVIGLLIVLLSANLSAVVDSHGPHSGESSS